MKRFSKTISNNYKIYLKHWTIQKQQLKTAYRKASRLCHPDKLAEDAKAMGEEFFKALNEACRHQDLKRVQGILLKLEAENTSLVAASERIDDRAILQQKIVLYTRTHCRTRDRNKTPA